MHTGRPRAIVVQDEAFGVADLPEGVQRTLLIFRNTNKRREEGDEGGHR
jgi:hypothetical protein